MTEDDERADRDPRARARARLEQIAQLLGKRIEDFFEPAENGEQVGNREEAPSLDDDRR